MIKKFSLLVVGLLILSSLSTIGLTEEADVQQITLTNTFSKIHQTTKTIENEAFIQFETSDSLAVLHQSGKPVLPRKIQTFKIPFGSQITDVTYTINDFTTSTVSQNVIPAPQDIIRGMESEVIYEMDETVYQSNEFYPNDWFRISTGGGLNSENGHSTFVTLETFPVRYNPVTNQIQTISDISIEISYQEPETSLIPTTDEYDMLIIAPSAFKANLQPLIEHKNDVGISTYLKTTDELYAEYDGFDKPEQIKYGIKDAFDNQGITYVMLVGGMTSPLFGTPRDDKNQGSIDWHVPVRYTNLKEMGSTYDPGYISDMYYADLYDGEGNFSSWDSDRNGESDGIYANWRFGSATDYLDLYPDVYVGRLACRNNMEVQFMVDKIITYETETAGSEWFNRMIGIGGDSHHDAEEYCEGEVLCNYVYDTYMDEFTPVKLYSSFKESDPDNIPSDTNIIREVSDGAGYLLFDGHGSPGSWNTHWPGEFNWDDTPGGISVYDFFDFENVGKYPICVVGGCHNSQFNITLFSTLLNKPFTWAHGVPYAECFGWHMARTKDGGSIASLGNTGLGYGAVGNTGDIDGDGEDLPDTVEALGGYQEVMFFKAIDDGIEFLGEAWGTANIYYANTFPPMEDQTDCKTLSQWPLLGDPSLKIGGYS
ncbi:MAG: hypothetical protein KGY65_08385 [Candidatus Thermoplasmatota archaeon]|nr:hypothetical protein [Candidatus Thermoplasmatota archaeon]MBS3802751.1 hypothetical protein [Candidatus Thermoplasmatota archaeon]